MPSWIKYHNEKDIRIVRKVYSIGDLQYINDYEQFSSNMSKSQFEKIKHHIPSSSNLTLTDNTMLTSTFGKLLARKLTHHSIRNITKSTNDLNSNCEWYDSSIVEKNMISKENIQFIGRIGKGKFGTVFKGFYRTKQNELLTVAIKKFNYEFNYDDISKEVFAFQNVKHLHIVQFFGIIIDTDNSIMFINEYAHAKSLYECLISTNAKYEYSMEILLEYLKQITSAMNYLEKKFLIHQNLSCRNFLVFNKTLIKLSDLGCWHWNTLSKDKLKLPIPWMSPEAIHYYCFTTASDVFSFGVSMWECFSYGDIPWKGLTNDEIANAINTPNHKRLPRPPYATSELYQIMHHCWKYEPSERPTFSQLEKTLREIEFKQVRWKENNNKSINLPDGFLSIESCRRGPLTILDRCDVEPLHIISIPKQTITTTTDSTSSTMNYIFHRKIGIKRNATKTKSKSILKNMISSPQSDVIDMCSIEVTDKPCNDKTCLPDVKKADIMIEPISKQPAIEQESNNEQTSSLLDEVMQAFTEIYSDTESTFLSQDNLSLRLSSSSSSQSPKIIFQSSPIKVNQYPSTDITDLPSLTCFLSQLKINKSNKLEEHSRNGDLTKQGKHIYNSSCSSSTHDERSSSASSSSYNQEKSDSHSHYSSISTDNDDNHSIISLNSRTSSINKNKQEHSITGQPLPPPPDLSSLGSKLTTATMKRIFELPTSLTSNKYRRKSMNNLLILIYS
ncbi:unnamed protein product [Rotaria sordida]|uniref:Protein kinase domain-containing protein n=2 Tax=Rotaria sordida TaxID=392033 RepID=A0A819HPR9_9BILA|nr:unnamed protein product [Rotaria sordida]